MLKELDPYSINSNDDPTYISISEPLLDDLITNQKKELGKFGITVTDENEGLPSMYWTPKKHKVLSKARFIVAAKRCTIKLLAKCTTAILKRSQAQITNYNASCYSNINSFWVVQNKEPVISAMENLNAKNKLDKFAHMNFLHSTLKFHMINLNRL